MEGSEEFSENYFGSFDNATGSGKSGNPPAMTVTSDCGSTKTLKLRLIGHCIFCLRKVDGDSKLAKKRGRPNHDNLQVVPKAKVSASSDFLNLFNQVWPYVQQKKGKCQGRKEDNSRSGCFNLDEVLEWEKKCSEASSPEITFSRLPTLCQICADKVLQVETLMEAVRSQMEVIKNVIKESTAGGKYSWRGLQFYERLKMSRLELEEIDSTLEFLNEVSGGLTSGKEKGRELQTDNKRPVKPTPQSEPPVKRTRVKTTVDTGGVIGGDSDIILKTLQELPNDYHEDADVEIEIDHDEVDWEDEDDDASEKMSIKNEDSDPDFVVKSEPEDNESVSSDDGDEDFVLSQGELSSEEEVDEEEDEVLIKSSVILPRDSDAHDTIVTDDDPLADVSTTPVASIPQGTNDNPQQLPSTSTTETGHKFEPVPAVVAPSPPKKAKAKAQPPTQASHPFKCEVAFCLKTFPTESKLLAHQSRIHPNLYNSVPCTCGKSFVSEERRQKHMYTSTLHKLERQKLPKITDFHKCDMCGARVLHNEILNHVRGHVGDYALKCPRSPCPHACTNSQALMAHVSAKHSEKQEAWSALNNAEFTCETCHFKTDHRLYLDTHLKHEHERVSSKNFPCPLPNCDKVFTVRQSVDFHLPKHNLKPVTHQKCAQCSEQLKIEDMTPHLRDVHQVSEIISCPQCPCVFPARKDLLEHLYVHRQNGLSCDICGTDVIYKRHLDLRQHYSSAHQIEMDNVFHKCEFSERTSWTKHQLNSHMGFYHTKNKRTPAKAKVEKTYPCDICLDAGSTFKTEPALISHKITVHGADPFTCQTCGATFDYLFKLSVHEKEEHLGIVVRKKEFKCEIAGCGLVFQSKARLKSHQFQVHDVGDTFVCDLCGKVFLNRPALKNHHDAVHLNLRKYVCETCGESFTSSTVLSRHVLIHTGERPFACTICDQRFRQRDVLQRHMRSHEEKGRDFKPNGPMAHIRKRKGE